MSGNIRPQSSHLGEPLWPDPGMKSGINVRKLLSTLKKKVQTGNEWSNILPKFLASEEKATNKLRTTRRLMDRAAFRQKLYGCLDEKLQRTVRFTSATGRHATSQEIRIRKIEMLVAGF